MASLAKAPIFIVLCGIAIYLLKQYMQGCVCISKARLDGKVTLITGANTGIGKETAVDFARRGAKVYMACRSLDRGSAARQEVLNRTAAEPDQVVVMNLDLGSLASVRQFAQDFKARESKLHILVNNAGVMFVSEGSTEDGFELTFGINHLGHFLLTHLLMEPIVAAQPARIITVSSNAHKFGSQEIHWEDVMLSNEYSRYEAYFQSKLANVMLSAELATRLKETLITTYSLSPGPVHTELGRYFVPNYYLREGLQYLVWPFLKDPFHGAQTQIFCSVAEGLEKESGKYYSNCIPVEPATFSKSESNNKRLWDMSSSLVKLQAEEIHPLLK